MVKQSYEMGYTPTEFEKTLLGQFSTNTSYKIKTIDNGVWSVSDDKENVQVNIQIAVGPPRKIAMLTLPVLKTHFLFEQSNETQRKSFMKIFFKYFHKGGG